MARYRIGLMHRYGSTLLAVIGAGAFALAVAGLGGGAARADTCCTGVYVTGVIIGGGGFIGDIRNVGPTQGLLTDDSARDSGAGGGAAIGFNWKRLGAPIRTEIEYAHMVRLDYDSRPIYTNNLSSAGFEDNVSSTSIMLNVLYDFNVGSSWWRPYAGFGIGYARNESDVNYNDFNAGGADAPDVVKRFVGTGASPRGAQAMLLASKIRALFSGRYAASLDDVKVCALPALRHRILLNFEGEAEGIRTDQIIEAIIAKLPEAKP